MIKENILREKILSTGSYYVAQQVDFNIAELEEHDFTEEEMVFLDNKGLGYVEKIIGDTYKPFTDLSLRQFQAIKDGLKDYAVYGLVNDWCLYICDFEYDGIMLDYLDKKEKELGEKMKYSEVYHTLYSRLYLTIMNIRDRK